MNYTFTKAFEKEFDKVKDKKLANALLDVIENVSQAKIVSDISQIKKLTGYKTFYRIKRGNYRIGIEVVGNSVIFITFDHRKDIYKRFP